MHRYCVVVKVNSWGLLLALGYPLIHSAVRIQRILFTKQVNYITFLSVVNHVFQYPSDKLLNTYRFIPNPLSPMKILGENGWGM